MVQTMERISLKKVAEYELTVRPSEKELQYLRIIMSTFKKLAEEHTDIVSDCPGAVLYADAWIKSLDEV